MFAILKWKMIINIFFYFRKYFYYYFLGKRHHNNDEDLHKQFITKYFSFNYIHSQIQFLSKSNVLKVKISNTLLYKVITQVKIIDPQSYNV